MTGEPSAKPKAKRSGTEKRERQPRVYARVTGVELARIETDAAAHALSVGAYLRWLALDRPETRPTRRALADEVLLLKLKSEAGRVDGNLAQFLKMANRGDIVPVEEIAAAARAVRDFYIYALETLKGAY